MFMMINLFHQSSLVIIFFYCFALPKKSLLDVFQDNKIKGKKRCFDKSQKNVFLLKVFCLAFGHLFSFPSQISGKSFLYLGFVFVLSRLLTF